MRKIIIIGPILPFTGGISHSNTVLCSNLVKSNEVCAISFSMMFPKLLYPGKSQKDGSYLDKTKFEQEFMLNTLNPFSWVKVALFIRKKKPDWLIFQWWHPYFSIVYSFISVFSRLFNSNKTKIGAVCHNVLPHEKGIVNQFIHKPLTKMFFLTINRVITLSESEKKEALLFLPKEKVGFIVENDLSMLFSKPIQKKEAMQKLDLPNKKIILFFGAVRPYKGLEDLIAALSIASKKRNDLFLVVAGAFWKPVNYFEKIAKNFGVLDKILFIDKYVPDKEVPFYFCSSDLVVLPHRSSTQSAIPQLALAYQKPMVITSVGGNVSFVTEKKNGFIVPPASPKKLADAINKFFEGGLKGNVKENIVNKQKEYAWTPEKERSFFGD